MNDRLEELEDLVIGQDVSVSYKRVSKDFNVHVNNAKKILSTFADKHKDAVSETHLFSSKVISDVGSSFGWQFCLVHKEDVQLLNKSKKFENTSSHVYSVYQGSRSKEILADIATRSENPGESFSGIQNKNVCIRDSNSRRKFTSKVAEPPAFTKKKQEEIKKKPEEKPIETNAKAEESIKEEEKKEPQSEKDSKSKTASAINKNKRQGGIANFFQRGAAAATAKVEPKPVVKKEEGKKEEPEPKPKVEDEKKIVKQEKPAPKKGKQSSKRKSAKLDNHSEKKRKRIMIASDSESSDEERMEEDDVEVDEPAPPTAEAVKEEKKNTQEQEGVCRERKLVDETFVNEKGFIVTKKVWVTTEVKVDEDKKENEDVKIAKEEVKKAPDEKPAAKKKQAGIMSFFSRK